MTTTFKNAVAVSTGTSVVSVYTAAALTTSVVTSLVLANTTASQILANVSLTDTSAGATSVLIKNAPIPAGSNLVVLDSNNRLVLETTDILKVQSDTASSLDTTVALMEIV